MSAPAGVRRFEDVAVGDVLRSVTVRLTRAHLVRYAGASGDFNVIHWDERSAREVGLPDVIAHGMLTMGQALQVVTDWLGDPGRILEYGVSFKRPVAVDAIEGAELELGGSVLSLDADARQGVIEISASVEGQAVLGRARATVQLG
jgi:acyl dehydratase